MNKQDLLKQIETSTTDYIIVPKDILLKLLESSKETLNEVAENSLKETNSEAYLRKLSSRLVPDSPTLPNDIKVIRKKLGISQHRFAELAELKQPDVSDFENMKDRVFEEYRKTKIINAAKKLVAKNLRLKNINELSE